MEINQNENENVNENEKETGALAIPQEETDEVKELLDEMRQNGPILAHPMMYVSALHNKQGSYHVDQNDDFFKRNGITFIELAPKPEAPGWNPPDFKYLVNIDDSGSFRHSLVPNK